MATEAEPKEETPKPAPVAVAEPPPKRNLEAGAKVLPIIPRNLDEIARYADWYVTAGMAPDSYICKADDKVLGGLQGQERLNAIQVVTRARIMIGIEKGLEVGMGPVTALSTIMIINNRPCLWGDGAVALINRDNRIEWSKTTWSGEEPKEDWTCTFTIKRRDVDEPFVGKFSVKDAMRAKLWANANKKPWIEYPQRMLFNRARAWALRDGFADCLMGLGIAEELMDIPPEIAAVPENILGDAPQARIEGPKDDGERSEK